MQTLRGKFQLNKQLRTKCFSHACLWAFPSKWLTAVLIGTRRVGFSITQEICFFRRQPFAAVQCSRLRRRANCVVSVKGHHVVHTRRKIVRSNRLSYEKRADMKIRTAIVIKIPKKKYFSEFPYTPQVYDLWKKLPKFLEAIDVVRS